MLVRLHQNRDAVALPPDLGTGALKAASSPAKEGETTTLLDIDHFHVSCPRSEHFRLPGDEGKGDEPSGPTARWTDADEPGNPFGVRLLNLMENLRMTSTTTDPALAARAVSWAAGTHRAVEVELDGTTHACNLRYPARADLAPGLLYRPSEMEDKWVIAYRDGRVAVARSWTGKTMAVARARLGENALYLSRLTIDPESGLDRFGDPVRAFDWLVRSHAFDARLPLPTSAEGAELLSEQPLMASRSMAGNSSARPWTSISANHNPSSAATGTLRRL